MDKEIASGKIGSDGAYKVEFKDAKLRAEASYSAGVTAGTFVEIPADVVIDAIEKKAPNVLVKEVMEILRAALKA